MQDLQNEHNSLNAYSEFITRINNGLIFIHAIQFPDGQKIDVSRFTHQEILDIYFDGVDLNPKYPTVLGLQIWVVENKFICTHCGSPLQRMRMPKPKIGSILSLRCKTPQSVNCRRQFYDYDFTDFLEAQE